MRNCFLVLLGLGLFLATSAQSYEGILRVNYKDEAGKTNAAEVFIKGDKYYIKKTSGGCEKYSAYILDAKAHTLSCLDDHNPKTAVSFDINKVLDIYVKNNLKPGYKIHESQPYKTTSATKAIGEVIATEKKAAKDTTAYEIWTADIKVDFSVLIPVLRIAGFWNKQEDGSNAILEAKNTVSKSSKSSTISVLSQKTKIDDKVFEVPKTYQVVDLNKFINEQAASPKLGGLVKAFAGF